MRIKRLVCGGVAGIGKFVLLLSTFAVGMIGTFVFSEFLPPTVTLCQLEQNPNLYRWRMVKVEADAEGRFGSVTISDETCQPTKPWIRIWWRDEYQPNAEVEKLYSESKTEIYKARVLVTGRFDPDGTKSCFGPMAVIRASGVELKSAIITEIREKPETIVSKQESAAGKFFAGFQEAVARNNKKQVAAMMQYPLRVNFYTDARGRNYRFIESADELLKVYDRVFAVSVKDYIAKFNPEKVWGNEYFMQTDSGQIGIAVSCPDDTEKCVHDFKVKLIHSNSIEIDYRAALCGGGLDCWMKADDEQKKRPQN